MFDIYVEKYLLHQRLCKAQPNVKIYIIKIIFVTIIGFLADRFENQRFLFRNWFHEFPCKYNFNSALSCEFILLQESIGIYQKNSSKCFSLFTVLWSFSEIQTIHCKACVTSVAKLSQCTETTQKCSVCISVLTKKYILKARQFILVVVHKQEKSNYVKVIGIFNCFALCEYFVCMDEKWMFIMHKNTTTEKSFDDAYT